MFSTDVLRKAKLKAHYLYAQISVVTQITLCKKFEFTLTYLLEPADISLIKIINNPSSIQNWSHTGVK